MIGLWMFFAAAWAASGAYDVFVLRADAGASICASLLCIAIAKIECVHKCMHSKKGDT